MSDTTTTEGQTTTPEPVKFNNKTYTLEELGNLQADVKATEHNLMSDYNKKMNEIKQAEEDIEKKSKGLDDDLDYLAAHPEVFMSGDPRKYYHPKVEGGQGEVVPPPRATLDDLGEQTTPTPTAFPSHDHNVKIS